MPARKHTLFILAVGIVGVAWLLGEPLWSIPLAHAQVPVNLQEGVKNQVLAISTAFSYIFQILSWIIFTLLSYFLDPKIIFDLGANNALTEMLNKIWQLSRDLMNLICVFTLIGVAIYSVVVANGEKIMQMAPKFVLAVVLVNFSWFFPRVIFDVANVAASAIYGIPSLIGSECKFSSDRPMVSGIACNAVPLPAGSPPVFTCPCQVVADVQFVMGSQRRIGLLQGVGYNCDYKMFCYKKDNINPNMLAGHSAILNGLVINHMRLEWLGKLNTIPSAANRGDSSWAFLITTVLTLIIQTSVLFPLAAMLVAFVVRIPIMWLTIAFMPFYFLDWILGDYTQGYPKQILESFVKAAFLPALVAIPLSAGYILLNAAADLTPVTTLPQIQLPLMSGVGTLWQIVWLLMALMVIYTGVFTVLDKFALTEGMRTTVASIRGAGVATRNMALGALKNLPIPGTQGMPVGKEIGPDGKPRKITLNEPLTVNKLLGAPGRFKDATGPGGKVDFNKLFGEGKKAPDTIVLPKKIADGINNGTAPLPGGGSARPESVRPIIEALKDGARDAQLEAGKKLVEVFKSLGVDAKKMTKEAFVDLVKGVNGNVAGGLGVDQKALDTLTLIYEQIRFGK